MCLSQYCTVASLSSCSWYLVPWAAESRGIEVCQRMAFPKNASSTRSFKNASYIASSPSSKQTKTMRNVAGDDNKCVFYGYIYIIWYDISDIYERNAMTIIVHPGISCCRVKGTSAFWKCHETFETSYQWLVPGLWYSRPFRGYAWLRYSPRQVWWAPLWQDLWPRPLRPLWPWPTRGSARGAECCNKNPCMEKCRVIHI